MDPPREREGNTVPRESRDDELSLDQIPVRIREPPSASERKEIKNFVEKLNTVVKFEIQFLKDIFNYHSSNEEYPFESFEALEDFTKNWIGLSIPKMAMLTQLTKLKENYSRRAKQIDEGLCPLEDDDNEAFLFGKAVWGSETEDEYAADEVKNTKKKSQVEDPGIGQDQDPNVRIINGRSL